MVEFKIKDANVFKQKDIVKYEFKNLEIECGANSSISENALFISPNERHGTIKIGNNCKILGYSVIHFDCIIGNGVLINHNTVLMPDITIGDETYTGSCIVFEPHSKIGKRCGINANSHITGYLEIEDDVFIGPSVTFTNDLKMSYHRRDHGKNLKGAKVEYGARIGAGATIFGHLTIGNNSIVGAGSLVTKDVPPETIVYGIPAKVIRKIDKDDMI